MESLTKMSAEARAVVLPTTPPLSESAARALVEAIAAIQALPTPLAARHHAPRIVCQAVSHGASVDDAVQAVVRGHAAANLDRYRGNLAQAQAFLEYEGPLADAVEHSRKTAISERHERRITQLLQALDSVSSSPTSTLKDLNRALRKATELLLEIPPDLLSDDQRTRLTAGLNSLSAWLAQQPTVNFENETQKTIAQEVSSKWETFNSVYSLGAPLVWAPPTPAEQWTRLLAQVGPEQSFFSRQDIYPIIVDVIMKETEGDIAKAIAIVIGLPQATEKDKTALLMAIEHG